MANSFTNDNPNGQPVEPSGFDPRFVAPNEDSPFIDEFGWSPDPRRVPGNTPDPARTGDIPNRDVRPDARRSPLNFWRKKDADKAKRHTVESVDADGWEETKEFPGYDRPSSKRFADNPRLVPSPEPRITSRLAPSSYSFTRPFLTDTAKVGERQFNGMHFSMADHRREYEVMGMAPARNLRNTYRMEPEPWDNDIVDLPPVTDVSPDARIRSVNIPMDQSRNWRLS